MEALKEEIVKIVINVDDVYLTLVCDSRVSFMFYLESLAVNGSLVDVITCII